MEKPLISTICLLSALSFSFAHAFDCHDWCSQRFNSFSINSTNQHVKKSTAKKNTANNKKPAFKGKLLLTKNQWRSLRQQPNRYTELIASCHHKLNYKAQPVGVLKSAPRYNRSGDNKGNRKGSLRLKQDAWAAYDLAMCYQLTQDTRYATTAQHILDAWATRLTHVKGKQAKADINFNMPTMVMAGFWVRGVGSWDDCAWRRFLSKTIKPLSLAYKRNNHANWGNLLDVSIAVYLNDKNMLRQAYQRWQTLMIDQIDDSGRLKYEMCRSDTTNWCGGPTKGIKGMAYTHYALLPTALAAQIYDNNGMKFKSTKAGKKLAKAYDRTAVWMNNPSSFPYYKRNKGKLIGIRNAAYFAILHQYFPKSYFANKVIKQGNLKMDAFRMQMLFAFDKK